jgi:hypothetical protein
MNGIIVIIGSFPYAVIRNIYIDGVQASLLAGIILSVLLCLLLKNVRWLWIALVMSTGFSGVDWIHVDVIRKSHITVYNINNKTAVDLMSNGNLYSYGDFDAFRMASNRVRLGIRSSTPITDTLIVWKGLHIMIAKSPLPVNLDVDILILCDNVFKTLPKVKCKKIIIDGSNSFYIADKLLREVAPSGVHVYSVAHSGAFQYSF